MRVQNIFRPRLVILLVMIPFIAALAGCSNTPEIKADYKGIDHLSAAQRAEEKYPSATKLPQISPGQVRPPYRLGAQDELIVSVYGREDLGSQIPTDTAGRIRTSRVQDNGSIVLPLIGPIPVAGKSIDEAQKVIADRHTSRLDISYVDVQLHSCHSQSVNITGAINSPGHYYLCDRLATLGDLLTAAEGLTEDAYTAGGILKRGGQTYRLDYPLIQESNLYMDIQLQAGDSVYFPRTTEGAEPVVFVFGEVGRQGNYVIPPQGMTLLEALGQASGADNITAGVDKIYIMRQPPGSEKSITYEVTLAELYEGPEIPVANGDRIFVAPSDMAQWDRWWRQAIPFMSIRGPSM